MTRVRLISDIANRSVAHPGDRGRSEVNGKIRDDESVDSSGVGDDSGSD